MKVHSIKTDNANEAKKVSLRSQATAHLDCLRVLDLFAGENVLWSHFETEKYYGVEKERGKGKNLKADNVRIIASLDLSEFNVIDVDSYGIPFNQLFEIFKNSTLQDRTVIIYTCITNKMSGLNKRCLEEFNLSRIYKKAKTVINAKATELFYAYLYNNGIKEVYKYTGNTSFSKDYGYFIVDRIV